MIVNTEAIDTFSTLNVRNTRFAVSWTFLALWYICRINHKVKTDWTVLSYALIIFENTWYVSTGQALKSRRTCTWRTRRMTLLTARWNAQYIQRLRKVTKPAHTFTSIKNTECWTFYAGIFDSIKFFNTNALFIIPNLICLTFGRWILNRWRGVRFAFNID